MFQHPPQFQSFFDSCSSLQATYVCYHHLHNPTLSRIVTLRVMFVIARYTTDTFIIQHPLECNHVVNHIASCAINNLCNPTNSCLLKECWIIKVSLYVPRNLSTEHLKAREVVSHSAYCIYLSLREIPHSFCTLTLASNSDPFSSIHTIWKVLPCQFLS